MSGQGECRFCEILRGDQPAEIVLDEPLVAAFLDHRPLFPGHALLVPREHWATLGELPPELVEVVFASVRRLASAVTRAMGGEGSFVALNNVVGQSVPHLHVHVVPRRRGDGLRGFFWPRQRYPDDAAMAEAAASIRSALADDHSPVAEDPSP